MRGITFGVAVLFALAISAVGPVHAGWFSDLGKGGGEKVDQLTPDATVRLTFLDRPALGFDPSQLLIEANYEASKPEEKGVRRETHETSTQTKVPIPFGGSRTQKYKVVVERSFVLPSRWIRSEEDASLVIRVPEYLPGPGAYRLSKLEFPCLDEVCERHPINRPRMELTITTSTGPASKMSDVLYFDMQPASSVIKAAYSGRELVLRPSQGSQAAFAHEFNKQDVQKLRAVQDANGRWHISANAQIKLFADYTSCHEPYMGDKKNSVNPDLYPALAWARRFASVIHSEVYLSSGLSHPSDLPPVHPGNWTGCAAIKGESLSSGEEVRYYGFNEGRLIFRRLYRYDRRVSLNEEIEIDSSERPLFIERKEYVHRSMKETRRRWSRLVDEALPKQSQDAIAIDVPALMREAEDVKKVIAHSFPSTQ